MRASSGAARRRDRAPQVRCGRRGTAAPPRRSRRAPCRRAASTVPNRNRPPTMLSNAASGIGRRGHDDIKQSVGGRRGDRMRRHEGASQACARQVWPGQLLRGKPELPGGDRREQDQHERQELGRAGASACLSRPARTPAALAAAAELTGRGVALYKPPPAKVAARPRAGPSRVSARQAGAFNRRSRP